MTQGISFSASYQSCRSECATCASYKITWTVIIHCSPVVIVIIFIPFTYKCKHSHTHTHTCETACVLQQLNEINGWVSVTGLPIVGIIKPQIVCKLHAIHLLWMVYVVCRCPCGSSRTTTTVAHDNQWQLTSIVWYCALPFLIIIVPSLHASQISV